MSISEDRQSHLVHVVIDGIWKDDLVEYVDEDQAMRAGKRAMQQFAAEVEEIDAKARKMVQSLKRNVPEGTPEWDVMYSKYYQEEMKKRGD